jgi:hypothetical protein
MDTLFELSWRAYPATVFMLAGVGLIRCSVRGLVRRLAVAPRDPERAFALMCAFRVAMSGACLAAIGAGWCWQLPALVGLSLVILFEETLEASTVIAALAHDLRRRARERTAAPTAERSALTAP